MRFWIPGNPAPQGSKKAWLCATTGKVRMVESSNVKLKKWRRAVAHCSHIAAARNASLAAGFPKGIGLHVEIVFALPKPQKPKAYVPVVRPDLDKLLRAALDGLTGIAFADDSQIVSALAWKVYAPGAPGAVVIVREAAQSEVDGATEVYKQIRSEEIDALSYVPTPGETQHGSSG